jgi:uncharacterized metal-binding protein YceD (DUF177 family)
MPMGHDDDTGADATAARLARPLRVARLSRVSPTPFSLQPDAADHAALAALLGLSQLRKLRFSGEIAALPDGGWELTGTLGATVVQPCSVTLQPVSTRIDETVVRRYLPHLPAPVAGETELPEDVDTEPLGSEIDPGAVMLEALALAVPAFPRAEGVELGEAVFTEPGVAPLRDEDTKPLAGLAALRDRLTER